MCIGHGIVGDDEGDNQDEGREVTPFEFCD